jgi:hypothetical protein
MVFMGFELNMPHYLHRSLFKMAKTYKCNQADTNLFHYGLIKMIMVYELGLCRDCGRIFLNVIALKTQAHHRLINLW